MSSEGAARRPWLRPHRSANQWRPFYSQSPVIGYEVSMTQEIVIRPANEHDRDFVVGLVPSLLEFGSPGWRDPGALRSGFAAMLVRALISQDHRAAVLIAQTRDETPLGFIALKVVDSIDGGERAHVADLAVAEIARRSGVGSALMGAGEAWARERGFDLLGLDVWATNDAALAFYRRLGYSVDSLTLVKRLD
jgi:ribosomal protein S18 acetylase RimI-like enzyme